MDESLGTTEVEKPAITPEEYGELRGMQSQQTFLQSQGYQAYNFIKNLDTQYEEITRNYHTQKAQAQTQLDEIEKELATSNTNFQDRFKEIVAQYGFDGATSLNIEETEPHYVTVAASVAPEAPEVIESEESAL
jgi:tryptophan 2,3-dioxygenase